MIPMRGRLHAALLVRNKPPAALPVSGRKSVCPRRPLAQVILPRARIAVGGVAHGNRESWLQRIRSAVENTCRMPNLLWCYFYHFSRAGGGFLDLPFCFQRGSNEEKNIENNEIIISLFSQYYGNQSCSFFTHLASL